MSYFIKQSAQAEDYRIRSQRLCIPFTIVANATPASKSYSDDLPQVMILSLQGQTAAAAAADPNCNFASPSDSGGVFGILLHNLGLIQKIQRVSVDMLSSGTASVALNGVSGTGITLATQTYNAGDLTEDASGQNMAMSVTWSGNLTTTNLTATLSVDYTLYSN